MDSADLKAKNDDVKMLLKSDKGLLNLNYMGFFNLVDSGGLRENDVTMCIAKNANECVKGLFNSACKIGGPSETVKGLCNSAWKSGDPNETMKGLCNSA